MKLGSREADEAYDRWHDRMADEHFGANEDDACEICGGDQDAMHELIADAERFRALREWSAQYAKRYDEAKSSGIALDDVTIEGLPMIPGVVAVLSAEDFTAAVDELMRSNAEVRGASRLAGEASSREAATSTAGLGAATNEERESDGTL